MTLPTDYWEVYFVRAEEPTNAAKVYRAKRSAWSALLLAESTFEELREIGLIYEYAGSVVQQDAATLPSQPPATPCPFLPSLYLLRSAVPQDVGSFVAIDLIDTPILATEAATAQTSRSRNDTIAPQDVGDAPHDAGEDSDSVEVDSPTVFAASRRSERELWALSDGGLLRASSLNLAEHIQRLTVSAPPDTDHRAAERAACDGGDGGDNTPFSVRVPHDVAFSGTLPSSFHWTAIPPSSSFPYAG